MKIGFPLLAWTPAIVMSAGISLAAAIACGDDQPAIETSSLPLGVVARVGAESIREETISRIARAQGVAPKRAFELALFDALFSQEARHRLEDSGRVAAIERGVMARAVLEALRRSARAKGPVSRKEVEEETARQWLTYDRPASVKTSHVVVRVLREEQRKQARALAEKFSRELAGIEDAAGFLEKARSIDHQKLEVVAESLPPVAEDGRVVSGPDRARLEKAERFESAYARAAFDIKTEGGQSGIAETPFGYHVILLEKRLPAERMPYEQRARALFDDILVRRAKEEKEKLLAKLRQGTEVNLADGALHALVRLQLSPQR